MTAERLRFLLKAHLNRQLTPDQEQELFDLIQTGSFDDDINQVLAEEWRITRSTELADTTEPEVIIQEILQQARPVRQMPFYRRASFRRLAAAAAIIGIVFLGALLLTNRQKQASLADRQKTNSPADIPPGTNGALLRLADGSVIVLDTTDDGILSQQGNSLARKEGSQIKYSNNGENPQEVVYNTIETPRGRQFQLALEDGTRIWLNALSSIRFPVTFTGKTRTVQITGEAYFEVAKDKNKPFFVENGDMRIEVLGTEFNVNAYGDAATRKTTLIEGSVKISNNSGSGQLKPGQQAQLSENKFRILNDADVEEAIAWKNGRFAFTEASLEDIMRQVSKWYDVEVVYSGAVSSRTFTADISRNTNLSELLKVLELSNIHFSIEGKKLIVNP